METAPLTPGFFERPVLEVARGLLGCVVTSRRDAGPVRVRLTEVEAYAGEADPGSHAWRGRTRRNSVMFGPPGRAYVYFTYGMHWCVNLVCGPEGTASAVLLRAGEVVAGLDVARARRPGARSDRDLARGPARLASCLGVTGVMDGVDTTVASSPLWVGSPAEAGAVRVEAGPRVGLSRAADRPWRLWLADEPTVSPYRSHTPRHRQARRSGTLDPDRPAPDPPAHGRSATGRPATGGDPPP